jgi:hypothetical protein
MSDFRVLIRPNGNVDTVYSDQLPLRDIGTLHTRRASNVEFDEQTQEWVATTVGGRELARGRTRAGVVAEEVKVLQREL